jgi:hypothetical protein
VRSSFSSNLKQTWPQQQCALLGGWVVLVQEDPCGEATMLGLNKKAETKGDQSHFALLRLESIKSHGGGSAWSVDCQVSYLCSNPSCPLASFVTPGK